MNDARIPPSIVIAVLELAEQRGVGTDALLAGTGVTRGQLDLPDNPDITSAGDDCPRAGPENGA
ncbi:hypothetical protein [Nocardia sp. NPDC050412]|uniref:hypothetical protein n=1 Tax=Nocardia sp. NPDC050412 TaxID=3364320 RepID=UPI0037BB72BF